MTFIYRFGLWIDAWRSDTHFMMCRQNDKRQDGRHKERDRQRPLTSAFTRWPWRLHVDIYHTSVCQGCPPPQRVVQLTPRRWASVMAAQKLLKLSSYLSLDCPAFTSRPPVAQRRGKRWQMEGREVDKWMDGKCRKRLLLWFSLPVLVHLVF